MSTIALSAAVAATLLHLPSRTSPIDRHALVTRHNVTLTALDTNAPLQVGNGHFAFGMDVTGLQSFVPFNTMSDWGWSNPELPGNLKMSDYHGQVWDTHGRAVRYWMPDPEHAELSDWLAANPHRINLGRIGMQFRKRDGSLATAKDLSHVSQRLDLWSGVATSRFEVDNEPVEVRTACHPKMDLVGVEIDSPLAKQGRLAVFLDCPGNDGLQFANYVGDWNTTDRLDLQPQEGQGKADFIKRADRDSYHIALRWTGTAKLVLPPSTIPAVHIRSAKYGAGGTWIDVTDQARKALASGQTSLKATNELGGDPVLGVPKRLRVEYELGGVEHRVEVAENGSVDYVPAAERRRFVVQPTGSGSRISFTCLFSKIAPGGNVPTAAETISASGKAWPAFWQRGGAIDFSASKDPRWKELERRVVLSEYLMAVNEAGNAPPQESGLVNNGWFGRYHMEMYWWHAAHWALWNRWPELERSEGIYNALLPDAKDRAAQQGYEGSRWPKCIGPGGREWPHIIHGLLIWQQPHPIFFAELDYRAHPTRATLEKWRPVVESTADFLASYAFTDPKTGFSGLGPPVVLVSENTDPKVTHNPAFELGYWRFGLRTAQAWRRRLGLPPNAGWQRVLENLAPLPQQGGAYVLYEGVANMWTKWNFEHPALTGTLGVLPGDGVDKAVMRKTLDKVLSTWNLDRTWGWDFPMLAMCAARLGATDRAVDLLLGNHPGFQFDARGLATGGPFPYFPSNGGLLYAVAMMAAGWDGSVGGSPGFPKGDRWKLKVEGLSPAP